MFEKSAEKLGINLTESESSSDRYEIIQILHSNYSLNFKNHQESVTGSGKFLALDHWPIATCFDFRAT